MKRILTGVKQEWCYWKFKIQWNKLKWVNPRSSDERKKIHFVCLQKQIV